MTQPVIYRKIRQTIGCPDHHEFQGVKTISLQKCQKCKHHKGLIGAGLVACAYPTLTLQNIGVVDNEKKSV